MASDDITVTEYNVTDVSPYKDYTFEVILVNHEYNSSGNNNETERSAEAGACRCGLKSKIVFLCCRNRQLVCVTCYRVNKLDFMFSYNKVNEKNSFEDVIVLVDICCSCEIGFY